MTADCHFQSLGAHRVDLPAHLLDHKFELSPFAGRAYAAYGGIYIAMSIIWAMTVEKSWPDRWDLIGMILGFGRS